MTPTKTTPKDFFLHLGAIIALYASVIALINLSFSIINYRFPDVLNGYFYAGSIAWPTSMLIVLVPIFYILEWLIKKDIVKVPEKNDIWIRRWKIFLTLFLTGAVIAGDLITLINTYLNGEISIRFVYKFFVILIVLAIIFAYYILLKVNRASKIKLLLAYLGIVFVLIAIICGFLVVGSPNKQRTLRFDNQRVGDLQNIQYQIVNYWQKKGKLPLSLDNLKDPISGVIIPNDPETFSAYEYSIKADMKFELCSIFSLKSENAISKTLSYPAMQNDNWTHEAGKICFERTIDKELYQVIPIK